jgi:hypothetical protein
MPEVPQSVLRHIESLEDAISTAVDALTVGVDRAEVVERLVVVLDRGEPPARPTFSTYRIHTGFDPPMCGIPSLDVAKCIARDEHRIDPEYVEFIDSTEPGRLVVFGESGSDEREAEEGGLLMFGREHDGSGWDRRHWAGSIAEEVRCACCHQITAVRTVRYDAERDRA